MRFNAHWRLEQAALDAGHDGRTSAGTAGQRLAGAALIDPQLDGVPVDDLHETGIHALHETRMRFDQRAVDRDRPCFGVGYQLHRMRVAHGNHGDPGRLAVDVERPQRGAAFASTSQAGGVERHAFGADLGHAHFNHHRTVFAHGQRQHALLHLHSHGR
jgi:hypothetical protein